MLQITAKINRFVAQNLVIFTIYLFQCVSLQLSKKWKRDTAIERNK